MYIARLVEAALKTQLDKTVSLEFGDVHPASVRWLPDKFCRFSVNSALFYQGDDVARWKVLL
jgi:hypothetical protein